MHSYNSSNISKEYDNNYSCSLRPIITLRPSIKGTGSGTSSDPYVLS